MSIDLAQSGRGVFYLNFRTQGDGTNSVIARSTQEFKFGNLVDHAADYIIAVERLYIPIQSIPMIDSQTPMLTIVPTGIGLLVTINTIEAFSIKEFMDNVNQQFDDLGVNIFLRLNSAGKMTIQYDDFANNNLQLNDFIRDIFDMPQLLTIGNADNNGLVKGASSIIDRFDQLLKIQIEVLGMNIIQEILDTDKSFPILTDIIVPSQYAFSSSENFNIDPVLEQFNFSYSTRQAVIYNAEGERRYAMLRGNSPIQNITLQCVAILKNNERREIILKGNSVFEAKIGFYKK